jgi:tetratricopeptide (TPR) repeat protein
MEKAAALRPDEPALWLRLARLHEELSDRPAQLKAYRQLARLSPKDPDVQFNLAVLLLDQKQPEATLATLAALAALEAAAQARPKDADIQGLMLDTLVRLGRWEQVTAAALAQIKDRPGDASLALKLYPQLAKHRPQGAVTLLEAALAGGAKDQRLYQLQAALALDQDDTAQAIKALEAEAQALPANLEIKLRLAGLYESAGQDEKARQAYEEVLDKDPAFDGAQERYLQFKTRLLDSKERGKEPAAPAKRPPAK